MSFHAKQQPQRLVQRLILTDRRAPRTPATSGNTARVCIGEHYSPSIWSEERLSSWRNQFGGGGYCDVFYHGCHVEFLSALVDSFGSASDQRSSSLSRVSEFGGSCSSVGFWTMSSIPTAKLAQLLPSRWDTWYIRAWTLNPFLTSSAFIPLNAPKCTYLI
jgi:hypothetical protein